MLSSLLFLKERIFYKIYIYLTIVWLFGGRHPFWWTAYRTGATWAILPPWTRPCISATFQQSNVSISISKLIIYQFSMKKYLFLDWSANIASLNLIENLWRILLLCIYYRYRIPKFCIMIFETKFQLNHKSLIVSKQKTCVAVLSL